MWIADQFIAICISLTPWCSDPAPVPATLHPDDAKAWDYVSPVKPEPVSPPATIVLNVPSSKAEPKDVVVTLIESKPKSVEPPKTEDVQIDPALVASRELLLKRRLTALDGNLNEMKAADHQGKNVDPNSLLSINKRPSASQLLNINTASTQERYDAAGLDSGLPVDNTRIITETEPIPVILREAINSQIPSKIVLRVERNIYGSHGRKILIPKFSEIVCKYESPDHANSSRIAMRCVRIIAAGKRYEINGLASTVSDQQGQGGVTGSVDRRFWERYGTAFILTGISTAVRVATGSIKSTAENQNAITAAKGGAEELSGKLGEITAKVLEETVSLKPIIRISQGTRMSITLGNDWYIAEPKSQKKGG